MSWTSKVIWSEGMFLRPQHFQQHDRYLEALIEDRARPLRPHSWGLVSLEISDEALRLGKIEVQACRAVMPDGTTVNIPKGDEPPASIELDGHTKDQIVYLTILQRRPNATEASRAEDAESATRFRVDVQDVRDASMETENTAPLELGRKRLALMLESEERAEYACLGLVRVIEVRSDKEVVLDKHYIPPTLDCRAEAHMNGYIKEIVGLLRQRGEALAGRVDAAGRGGTAEMGDFMLLQVVNRYRALFAHLLELEGYHPEAFWQIGLQMAGELATFTAPDKRPVELPRYIHDDLAGSFRPMMEELRRSLSTVMEQNAVLIELKERKYGIRLAVVNDPALFKNAVFVLAVKADMSGEKLRRDFPDQAKIGSPDQIAQLVQRQLSGVELETLAVAPRQIPFHAGFSYFELDRSGDMWKQIVQSGGLAMHPGGSFPGVEFELWAIKG